MEFLYGMLLYVRAVWVAFFFEANFQRVTKKIYKMTISIEFSYTSGLKCIYGFVHTCKLNLWISWRFVIFEIINIT